MKDLLNIVLIWALAFLLLCPENLELSIPAFGETPDAVPMAGYFEFAQLSDAADNGGDDNVVTCECGGDGDVGDGRIRIPCPCVKDGGVCNCPRMEEEAEVEPEPVVEIPANWTYAVLLTNPTWCVPCRAFDDNVIKKLDSTWKKADKEGGYTHIVIIDEEDPLVDKYLEHFLIPNQQGSFDLGVPTMLLIRNGEVKRKFVGGSSLPKTPQQFASVFHSVR